MTLYEKGMNRKLADALNCIICVNGSDPPKNFIINSKLDYLNFINQIITL